jgi:hypothetical protein
MLSLSKSGERLDYNAGVKPDGTYSQKVVDGAFHAEGTLELNWNGKVYHVRLHPVQNNRVHQESGAGIEQDFVWKLTGARPNGNGTYGPNLNLLCEFYRNDLHKSVPPAAGTKAVFTLTPKGTRIDGGEAKASISPGGQGVAAGFLTYLEHKGKRIAERHVAFYDGNGRLLWDKGGMFFKPRLIGMLSDSDVLACDEKFIYILDRESRITAKEELPAELKGWCVDASCTRLLVSCDNGRLYYYNIR